jgi:hypothetical protein
VQGFEIVGTASDPIERIDPVPTLAQVDVLRAGLSEAIEKEELLDLALRAAGSPRRGVGGLAPAERESPVDGRGGDRVDGGVERGGVGDDLSDGLVESVERDDALGALLDGCQDSYATNDASISLLPDRREPRFGCLSAR